MSDQGEPSAGLDDAAQSAADQQRFDVPSGGKPGDGASGETPAFDAFPAPSTGAATPEVSAREASVFRPPAVPMPQTGSQPLFVPETPEESSGTVFGQARLAQNAPAHT